MNGPLSEAQEDERRSFLHGHVLPHLTRLGLRAAPCHPAVPRRGVWGTQKSTGRTGVKQPRLVQGAPWVFGVHEFAEAPFCC